MIGHLEKNESTLIHCGAGATGLSAITIALSLNCEVYTIVSTTKKKEFIKKVFPQLRN